MDAVNDHFDEMVPLLDSYKKAWTTLYDSVKVAELKIALETQVKEAHPDLPKLLDWFQGQCWQIEQRWARPEESGRTVN